MSVGRALVALGILATSSAQQTTVVSTVPVFRIVENIPANGALAV